MSREIRASDLRSLLASIRDDKGAPETVVCNATGLLGAGGRLAGHLERLFDSGIDVVTMGAKALSRPASREALSSSLPVLRPINTPPGGPGRSSLKLEVASGACWLVSLDTGDDRLPVEPPWESFCSFEAALPDRLPILIDMHGPDLAMKQAFAWRASSLGRPVHLIGTGLGCVAGHAAIKCGRACVPDVGIAAEESSAGGVAPDVWWQIREHRKGASALPPERVMIDAVRLHLDDAGRAVSVERLRLGVAS
ncbi:MAG TPA: YmdB family metallophosphoesterase [Candidatus Ozemobacteraceae bacterium]|nr:YmdB family metallophosphoesterase [Candidatus Ozemobacteraceae bacterium]